eukprot:8841633-Pyramimonas_sp.AAC.1
MDVKPTAGLRPPSRRARGSRPLGGGGDRSTTEVVTALKEKHRGPSSPCGRPSCRPSCPRPSSPGRP